MKSPVTRTRKRRVRQPPDALMYIGSSTPKQTVINAVAYDESNFAEAAQLTIETAFALRDKGKILWINVDGLADTSVVQAIGERLKIHPLAIEDILNTEHRAKVEAYDDFLLIVLKSLSRAPNGAFESEQVSLLVGADFVVSFQEREGDVFRPILTRLQKPATKLRQLQTDSLMYALLDEVIDNYFLVIEDFGERIEALEATLVQNPDPRTLSELYGLKRSGLFLRRCLWPLREAVASLERGDSRLIAHSTRPFIRDLYSHVVEVLDSVETQREMLSSMLDIYLSSVSNRMNTVIKVLTIITTMFMPMSLVSGIYGMNFQHMPELSWNYGYYYALGVMLVVGLGMLGLFKWNRWI